MVLSLMILMSRKQISWIWLYFQKKAKAY